MCRGIRRPYRRICISRRWTDDVQSDQQEEKTGRGKHRAKRPFIVLADKLQNKTGMELNEHQKKVFEQCVATLMGIGGGVAYAALARQGKLNWLAGGAVFGTLFFLVEDEGMGTALGLVGDNTRYPLEAHLRGLVAHIAFGVVTAAIHQACVK